MYGKNGILENEQFCIDAPRSNEHNHPTFKHSIMYSIVAIITALAIIATAAPTSPDIITKHVHLGRNDKQGLSLARTASNGITYHGGPVMVGTNNHIYYIFYGDSWINKPNAKNTLINLAGHIGGTPWYNIQSTYYNGVNVKISNIVHFVNNISTSDSTYGKSLTDNNIFAIVNDALVSGQLPTDSNGIYFVLTASDVTETSGFCTSYCGWHTYGTMNGANIKYAFVGDASIMCPGGCIAQSTSISGDLGADGMASVIAHELAEAVSDPNLNAWYDSRGYENADKCAWTFGNTYTTTSGANANMKINNQDYLIQQNWVNANRGYCAL